jgi:hypothetical protein
MGPRDFNTPLVLTALMVIGAWASWRLLAPANVMEILRLFTFC